jgi:ubiquinone/menaquinone biosynthesis C-methylase UbiE
MKETMRDEGVIGGEEMGKCFPFFYDLGMKQLEEKRFKQIRRKLLEEASGRVLEIGSGTGINLPIYRNVERVDAVEPSPFMRKKAEVRMRDASVPIQFHGENAEDLPFRDSTFDTIVATLVFCTIPDPHKALREILRVSKPGAKLLFFEHVKMEQPVLALTQNALTPLWKKVCDGCHLNRDTLSLFKNAGYEVIKVKEYYKGLFIAGVCRETKKRTN